MWWTLVATAFAVDADNDGYSPQQGDCDDTNAAIHPGAVELVGDAVDQNCDGQELCYRDMDADGLRLTVTVVSADTDCADAGEARSGAVVDCNDNVWNAPFSSIAACDGPPCGAPVPAFSGDLAPANPGTAGVVNTLDLTGGPAGSTAVYVAGPALGATAVPGCPNLVLPFANASVLGVRQTNGLGDASLSTPVPAGAAGHDVWTVVVYPNCQTSCAAVNPF